MRRCAPADSIFQIFQEDDVGGVPERGGYRAAGLAGYDDFEKFGFGSQVGKLGAMGFPGGGFCERKVAKYGEDDILRGSKRSFGADTAELQKRVALVKMPG